MVRHQSPHAGKAPGRAPSQARARAHIEVAVARATAEGRTRLAPISVLAREAGVAYATMHKAVRSLVREGKLTARPSAGVHIADRSRDPAAYRVQSLPPQVGLSHGERVSAALERDLVLGLYRPGDRLPGLKELGVRYGASVPTIRKALARASVLGWVTGPSRPRVSPGPTRTTPTATLVMLGGETAEHPLFGAAALRLVDYECRAAGLGLAHYPFLADLHVHPRPPGLVAAMERREFLDSVVGFVLCTSGLSQEAFDEALAHVCRFGKPVAVVDDMGVAHSRLPSGSGADLLILPAGTGRASGRAVASFLARKGHLHVAYLSHCHTSPSSQARLEGLREGLAPFGGAVMACTSGDDPGLSRITVAWRKAWPTVKEFALSDALRRVLSPRSHGVAEKVFNRALLSLLSTQVVYNAIEPLAQAARLNGEVTAWVGFSDTVALACRNVSGSLSQNILLVGMDNTVEAEEERLTSYDFNAPAIMRAAVSHTLHSRRSTRRSTAPRVIEVEGFVVDRQA